VETIEQVMSEFRGTRNTLIAAGYSRLEAERRAMTSEWHQRRLAALSAKKQSTARSSIVRSEPDHSRLAKLKAEYLMAFNAKVQRGTSPARAHSETRNELGAEWLTSFRDAANGTTQTQQTPSARVLKRTGDPMPAPMMPASRRDYYSEADLIVPQLSVEAFDIVYEPYLR